MHDDPPPRRRRWRLLLLLLPPTLAVVYALLEPRWLEVTRHTVPDGVDSVRILHLTDLHLTGFGALERRVLEVAREARPDLIVITGDTIDHRTPDDAALTLLKSLRDLQPPEGVWACVGNHEDEVGPTAYALFEQAGVPLLVGAAPPLAGGRLRLHGATSWVAQTLPQLPDAPGLDVLLCHYPGVLGAAAKAGYEVVLAGHTHGGQLQIPGVGPLWLPLGSGNYVEGWYTEGDARMYVSRGVGTIGAPVRVWARPEVAVIDLELPPAP